MSSHALPPSRGPRAARAACLLLCASLAAGGCAERGSSPGDEPGVEAMVASLPDPVDRDWDTVAAGDTLRALFTYNSTSYFVYRGEAMGFEFRLLRAFAEEHGMALRPVVVRDRTELFRRLNDGEGDVVASRLVPIPRYREHVAFTAPLYTTRPTVVQADAPPESTALVEAADTFLENPPAEGVLPDSLEVRARLVQRPRELAGDTVHLPRASEYYRRLVELSDTIEGTIELVELERALGSEAVIRGVARGEISFTVAPENIADLREEYYTNLVVRPVMGRQHDVALAVRANAPALRDSLDAWIEREREGTVAELYETYFVDRKGYRERVESQYLTSETGRLSRYDSLLHAHAARLSWDWRLLASQTFQESRFDPRARSWAGARGLLQLMPATARDMGVRDAYDPEQNVRGAVRYLLWLEERWTPWVADPDERLRFILASYNAGTGHVEDARRLAEAQGDDPDSWDAVAYWLLQLSKRRWHSHEVVRFGYVRGIEPVTYVALILERYEHYREFVEERPSAVEAD